MPKVNFNPKAHGFHFPNNFTNHIVGDFETQGRCGGMAYAALDYYFAGLPIPRYTTSDFASTQGVPPDGHWLADYIYTRLIQSFTVWSAGQFITWTTHSDHETWLYKGVTKWTKEDEFPKLRAKIDAGQPVVLGLLSLTHDITQIGNHHQVVAYGYDYDPATNFIRVYIYDNNDPDKEHTLESDASNPHFNQSSGKIWRGFFIQDYSRAVPPVESFQAFFPSVHDYAARNGFRGGFPNFNFADYGNGLVYGTVLVRNDHADWRDIPASELGNPQTAEDRFRAVSDWASANGYVGGFPNFHQADYGNGVVYGTILLKSTAADWRDIRAAELGNPGSAAQRITAVNSWASGHGYVGAIPNFHQADIGRRIVYGVILLKPNAADWRDIPAADLGNPQSFQDRFRAVSDWASANGYRGAFPNFHEANYGNGVVYGTFLIKNSAADWTDIPAAELGHPATNEARFRAVNDWAVARGYVGGFPNFHEADYGGGVVYGAFLVKREAAEWRDIPVADLGNPASAEDRFRAVNDWASAQGRYAGGYPNFHEADYGGLVYGTFLLKREAAEWRDVPYWEL